MGEPLIGWKPFSDSPKVASARIRCRGPLAMLHAAGVPVELYREENRHRYRVIVLQKLYDPVHLALARQARDRGQHVVFDLCDNHFYNPSDDARYAEQKRWLREMVGIASVVTVPTPALASLIPSSATVIRDGVEPHLARSLSERIGLHRLRFQQRIELVWFGTWGNSRAPFGMQDLTTVADAVQQLAKKLPVRLTVISNSRDVFRQHIAPLPFSTRYLEWNGHGNLCSMLPYHDICVIPVRSNPFTFPKSANRLALSLYLGVPVVATALPSYEEFRPFCVLDDWYEGLQHLAQNADLRRAQADEGRQYVLDHHMMKHAAAEWKQLFDKLSKNSEID